MAVKTIRRLPDSLSLVWVGDNFVKDVLRTHGPGICTAVFADNRTLKFDISADGRFGVEPQQDPVICAKLFGMFRSGSPVAITLRTFTKERVAVRHGTERDRVIRVPVKELRGYSVCVAGRENGKVFLDFEKVPPDILRECYSYDAQTGEYTGLMVDERDHVFV